MGSEHNSKDESGDVAASVPSASPGWVPVPPTVNDQVRQLIWRFGLDAVKRALKEESRTKRGPKKKPDWKELNEFVETDARDWLEGRDPFKLRSNHAIAKAFAERHPGHSAISTFDRIKRKLRERPYGRRWHVLATAEALSRNAYPHPAHLRTLEALSKVDGHKVWTAILERARATIAEYEKLQGAAPPREMNMEAIEEAVSEAKRPENIFPSTVRRSGLFGFSAATDVSGTTLGEYLRRSIKPLRKD